MLARSSVTDGPEIAAKGRGAFVLGLPMEPNPFFNADATAEGHTPASLAYRYRKARVWMRVCVLVCARVYACACVCTRVCVCGEGIPPC